MGGGKYYYYRCLGTESHRHNGQAICDNRSVKGRELEARVWSEVCELLRDPSRLVQELERRQQQPADSGELSVLQRRVDDLRGRLDRLIDAALHHSAPPTIAKLPLWQACVGVWKTVIVGRILLLALSIYRSKSKSGYQRQRKP
jgi:hypothetical protein